MYEHEPDWSLQGDLDGIRDARATAMRLVHENADDPLCGLLLELEHIASPFYLGSDVDPDGSDVDDVFP